MSSTREQQKILRDARYRQILIERKEEAEARLRRKLADTLRACSWFHPNTQLGDVFDELTDLLFDTYEEGREDG